MKKHYRSENNCLNCGTTLQGKYCYNCGQENLEIRESFGHMMNHAISDYFHFDHQFFHTLKPLLFKPGYLTNEYLAGHRVQYLHPVKMYIFISVVYFLLLFQNGQQLVNVDVNKGQKKVATTKGVDSANSKIAKDQNLSSYQKKKIESGINLNVVSSKDNTDFDHTKTNNVDSVITTTTNVKTYPEYLAAQSKLPANKRDGLIERLYNEKAFSYNEKYGSRAKEVFWDEFKHNVPKMMFVLLPLFALILRITFWHNKKFYVEHLIFTFHLHCFLFLFLAIVMLLQIITPFGWHLYGWIVFAAELYICWYLYTALRVMYNRSRWRTITKMIGMTLMYVLAFGFCIFMVVFITALTAA